MCERWFLRLGYLAGLGDFNEVRLVTECRGYVGDRGGMADFVKFIDDDGLVDLLAFDKLFIWYGYGSKESSLDRFLVFAKWLDKFGELEQHNLPPIILDHASIRLSSAIVD
ncbi:hypothetical protein V6N13_107137 [Hibiscus sabdariffa]|uniref:Uncharacterized protein n=1 Tax=Hibiscus sabdariffa TaxID=183260 RepID=A0ABR2F2X3_9ROSI